VDELTSGHNFVTALLAAIFSMIVGVLFVNMFIMPKIEKLRAKVKELSAPPLEHSEITRRATRAVRALEAAAVVINGVALEGQYTPDHADDLRATLASVQPVLDDLCQAAASVTAHAGRIDTNPK
jgi:hypothetical protein